jgi:serine/threonine-protein kinase
VARVYDIGTHEGRRYISMELLRGRDLQGVPKPVSLAQAIDWLTQACDGLHSAHEQGVIHRDVKPENLFLTEQGRVKVMDFGIAKDTEVRRTRAGMMAGTPEFMSPEQINDMSQVTAATDIYSLGIVAYELLTGTIPFSHKELMPLLMMHAKEPPPPMRSRRPDLPPALDAAVLKALEKQPSARPQTALKFAEMLRAAIA